MSALAPLLVSAGGIPYNKEHLDALREERDSWRRVAERLEGEKQTALTERDAALSAFICEPAECAANCDIQDCPYTHIPVTWRNRAEAAEARALSHTLTEEGNK